MASASPKGAAGQAFMQGGSTGTAAGGQPARGGAAVSGPAAGASGGGVPSNFASIAFPSEPISVTLVPLRRPELFVQSHAVEATEPGDLLHEALNPPPAAHGRRTTWPLDCPQVLGTIAFPADDRARYLVGEMYRATLVIHNTTGAEVKVLSAMVVAQDPSKNKRTLVEFTGKVIAPHATLESRLEALDLFYEGQHIVQTLVNFADPTRAGERREVSRSATVNVQRGTIVEETTVVSIPPYLAPLQHWRGEGSLNDLEFFAALEQRYLVSATIANNSGGPLHFTEVVFKKSTATPDVIAVADIFETAKMLARDGLFLPGERRQFCFEVSTTPTPNSLVTPVTASPSASVQGSSWADGAQQRAAELGTLRWAWRRPNGDGGHGASKPFCKPPAASTTVGTNAQPLAANSSAALPPSFSLVESPPVASPAVAPHRLASSGAVPQPPSPLVVRFYSATPSPACVAEALRLTLVIINVGQRPLDVIVTLNADRFLPAFCFAGATHIHLGVISSRGWVPLEVELLPLMSGVAAVDASCFEFRVVGAPSSAPPLWPAPVEADGNAPLAQIAVLTRSRDDENADDV